MVEQLSIYTDQVLAYLNIDGSVYFFSNTISEYTLAFVVFLFGLLIFGLMQFFALSWLTLISKKTKSDLDDIFVKIFKSFTPPFYFFLSFWFALRFIDVYGTADSILTAVLVVWMVYQVVIIVGILVKDVVFGYMAQDKDETTKSAIHLIANLAKGIIWLFGILLVMSNFGINVTSLMAGAGIAGIAVAFALQGILSDLFSSFSIYFDKPFNVGDFIKTGDSMGTVRHIGIKSTRVLALTGEEIVLSNQELTSAKIQNFGLMEERRVVIHFGVVYETHVEKLKKIPDIVKKIIETLDDTRFDRSHFMSFGESSLNFETVYYILSSDYNVHMDRQQEIILALVKRFEEEGIFFAYPTRTILYSKK